MMRSNVLTKVLFILWCVFASGWVVADDSMVMVVVEINAIDMSEEKVENEIAEPVELLLGSLDDVFTVSAKYQMNKAVINVQFADEFADPDIFVSRVKSTIDSYMDKLPRKIESISVSLGEMPVTESSITEQANASDTPSQKNNRNKKVVEPESPTIELPIARELAVITEPGVIRSVEKRSMTGRYLGSIESSNEFLPIITTLTPGGPGSDSPAKGKYFMSESDAIVIGELSACYNNSGNVLTCQWRDKYGIGGVDLIFTPDYASFNGRWSINGKEGAYKWSGLKVKEN